MKKILFVTNTLGIGGAEKSLIELLRHLDGSEYSIDLYVLLGRGELMKRVPEHVRLLNRKVDGGSVLDSAGRWALTKIVFADFFRGGAYAEKLGSILRGLWPMLKKRRIQIDKLLWYTVSAGVQRLDEEYDVALAWLEGGAAYVAAKYVRAKKKLAVIHIDYECSGYTRSLDQDCWAQFERIFTVSEETRASFLRVYPEYAEKLSILPNLINQEEIRRRALEAEGFSDGYSGVRLLTVGRLTYQKALDISIDAMKLLLDAGYKARWYVLGEGIARERLQKKITALGLSKDFLLLGTVENPYPYYVQADIFIHATRFEGRSVAVQEAQTLGCAVIVSDTAGNHQQVSHNKDGLLCALDPKDIAVSIALLISDSEKRKRLGDTAMAKKMPTSQDIGELLELLNGGDLL